ncbi:MAG TPA: hypothetical protein VIF40_19265 [Methylosinus sp.]|uniref:hypothetical protein n=1 Tax=Methylosinus sp. TaxID=427 RepID=UPI002F929D76
MADRRRAMLACYREAKNLSLAAAIDAFAAETRIARDGPPEDIAELIVFAVSPVARRMTGVTLRIGGEIKSL